MSMPARKLPPAFEANIWRKGIKSPNPGGISAFNSRVRTMIRESTDDGAELVEYAITLLRNARASHKQRIQALEWLSKHAGLTGAPLDAADQAKDVSQVYERLRTLALSGGMELVQSPTPTTTPIDTPIDAVIVSEPAEQPPTPTPPPPGVIPDPPFEGEEP